MSTYYTKTQIDDIGYLIGTTIKEQTDPYLIAGGIDSLEDMNIMTDAEKTKLASLVSSKFLGTFLTSADIPVVDAIEGSYADVDAADGSIIERWIYDSTNSVFVKSVSQMAGETGESIKTKYEANADTNAFTDTHKTKLEGITEATDIGDFENGLLMGLSSIKMVFGDDRTS